MKLLEQKTAIATVLAASASVALWTSAAFGQAAGPFNATQVDAGHNAYVANCLTCHGDTMSGGGEAPPIAGRAFIASFGTKTTRELFDILKAGMP
jgi:mono/diheme cytochrome c family protein